MKNLLLIAMILLFSTLAKSQEIPDFLLESYDYREVKDFSKLTDFHKFEVCSKAHSHSKLNQLQKSKIVNRNYDVTNYFVTLDWYNMFSANVADSLVLDNKKFEAEVILKAIAGKDLGKTLNLDAGKELEIVSINENDKPNINYVHVIDSSRLQILLNKAYAEGDTIWFRIKYKYSSKVNESDQLGLFLYGKGADGSTERIAYTMNEPFGARRWLVCNDNPHDKAIYRVNVKVQKDYTALANGLLGSKSISGDTALFQYYHDYPMATYLLNVVASKFANFKQDVIIPHIFLDTVRTIENNNYVWEKDLNDTAKGGFNATIAYKNQPEMIRYYSRKFNIDNAHGYPFEVYNNVAIAPFKFGGMEHQTLTSINRNWLRGFSEWGVAHETMHHWFGNYTTCATFNDLWWNEGGATWGEALWRESYAGLSGYESNVRSNRRDYLNSNIGLNLSPINGLPSDQLFSGGVSLVYYKAGFVFHMLRDLLGEEKNRETLNKLMQKYAYSSLETFQIADFYEQENPNSPINMQVFFDQWISKAGHPVMEVTPKYLPSSTSLPNRIELTVKQVQKNMPLKHSLVPDVFVTPIEFWIYSDTTNNKYEKYYVIMDKEMQVFTRYIDTMPQRIIINPTRTLGTATFADITTSIEEENNQFNAEQTSDLFIVNNKNSSIFSLRIIDINGRVVHNSESSNSYEIIDLQKFNSGIYIWSIQTGDFIKTGKITYLKK